MRPRSRCSGLAATITQQAVTLPAASVMVMTVSPTLSTGAGPVGGSATSTALSLTAEAPPGAVVRSSRLTGRLGPSGGSVTGGAVDSVVVPAPEAPPDPPPSEQAVAATASTTASAAARATRRPVPPAAVIGDTRH